MNRLRCSCRFMASFSAREGLCRQDSRAPGKSLACDLVGGQRVGVDGRLEPWRNDKLARGETQWFGEQPHLRLQETVELAGIADSDTRDASFHPAAELARKAVAQHR